MLILDGDDLQHLLHVEDKIFEVVIFLDDLVNGECDSDNSLALHVECDLIFFRNEVRDVN